MRIPFYPIIDQVCKNRWCSLHGQPMGLTTAPECAECRGRLSHVRKLETGRALRAVVVLAISGGAITLLWGSGAVLGSLRSSMSLTSQEPRALDSAARSELSGLLRSAYRDGTVTDEERHTIDRATSARRLQAAEVATLEQELRPRVIAASRSLSTAKGHIDAHRLEAAVQEYKQATEIDPDDALAWAGLAAAYVLHGEAEAAERAYQRALSLDPDNWLANYNLGLAAARRGESEVALGYFRHALGSLSPGGPEHSAVVADLQRAPELAALRGDPRFAALLKR